MNKEWGRYSCNSRFSAVICQLNIDVHANGGLTTTPIPTTTAIHTTIIVLDPSETTPSDDQQSNSAVTNSTPSSRKSRSLLFRIAHDRLNLTSTTTPATPIQFDTLSTLSVVHFSNALRNISLNQTANTAKPSITILSSFQKDTYCYNYFNYSYSRSIGLQRDKTGVYSL